jgi:DNA-binding CsgD family transcriptional regulator
MADHVEDPAPIFLAPSLVGRERELTTLRAALDAALVGHGSLVLIGGEAGIGKTSLAEWALAEAQEQGATVLAGRCYDLSETPPYGPWAEALAGAPADDDRLPPLPDLLGETDATNQGSLILQARAYLTALAARRPLVLLLDDLHWADPASLDLLRVVARGLAGRPLLLLATYRAEEIGGTHPLAVLLPLLVGEARAARLDLRPLDRAAIAALVAARYALGAADRSRLVDYLAGRSEGNPLFLGELLRTLEQEGALHPAGAGWAVGDLARVPVPTLLRQVIAGRLRRLPPATADLLAVAAVVGQTVPLALWATVAGTDEDDLLAAVGSAVAAHLVAEAPDGRAVRFAHALIREVLYDAFPAAARRHAHRAAGEALAAMARPDPDAVADHLQRAGDTRTAAWLERAGARAQAAFAYLTAAARYEAALALLEAQGASAGARGWLLLRLAVTRRYGNMARALGHAEAAARLAGEAGDPLLAGLAAFLTGQARCNLGASAQGIAQMTAGLDALDALPASRRVPPGADAPLDPARRRGTVAEWLAGVGRYTEALALGERCLIGTPPITTADWLGSNPYADAHVGLGTAYAGLGQPDQALAALARARELLQAIGNHQEVGFCGLTALQVARAYRADRPAELRDLATEAEDAWRQADGIARAPFPPRVAWLLPLVLAGRWAEARATAEQGLGIAFMDGTPSAVLAPLARVQGDPARAWALLLGWLPQGPQTAPGEAFLLFALPLQRLATALALDAGELPAAHAWLEAHDRWLAWSGAVLGQADGALGWAAYHRAAGDLAAARTHAMGALSSATVPRQPLALLAARRLLGELATDVGQHAVAADHLAAALALADACEAPYERALTLLALADLHAAVGERAAAATTLDTVRALLAPLGARPALARADALAARLAGGPHPARPFGLTAREGEVLRLVAAGLTNNQVAERLFVTPRTVNAHLTSVYTKLGVANRASAIRLALDHNLR